MRCFLLFLLLLESISTVAAVSFLAAISGYPQLSDFTSFYKSNPDVASLLLANSSTSAHTVLVPNDHAFATYESAHGHAITETSVEELIPLLQYHVLIGSMDGAKFSQPSGVTVPTLLTGDQYNHRSAGQALSADFGDAGGVDGQVVFVNALSAQGKFRVRRTSALQVRSGMSSSLTMTAIDGLERSWSDMQSVNGSQLSRFLTLPQSCSNTVRNAGLTVFDQAVNATDLWEDINGDANYTCLAPANQALSDAGSPQVEPDVTALTVTLKRHLFTQALYTSFLEDGQEFTTDSENEESVQVRIVGGDIYFNDAKVLIANVM